MLNTKYFDDDHEVAILNPECNTLECVDAIEKRIEQSKALLDCIIGGFGGQLTSDSIDVNLLWLLKDQINEIGVLAQASWHHRDKPIV